VKVNGSVQPPPLRWNDFGGTIGGPVPLGHKDDHKTFFFFSEEARRIVTYSTFNPTLPTQGMLQGTFSQPVCTNLNIATATCVATGTQIPPPPSIPSPPNTSRISTANLRCRRRTA